VTSDPESGIPSATRERSQLPSTGDFIVQPCPDPVDLHRSAELVGMRGLLQAVPDAMAVLNPHGLVVMVNSQFERLLGWTQHDLTGLSIDRFAPEARRAADSLLPGRPLDDPQHLENSQVQLVGAEALPYAVRRDGTRFPAEVILASVRSEHGPLITVTVRDLSEQRAMEEKFRRFVESSPDIVVINTQTERMFGYARDELLGHSVEMIVPQPELDRSSADQALFFASPKVQAMGSGLGRGLFGQRKDGTQFPIEISQSPLQTEAGLLVSSAIRDVTQRRRADELRFRLAAIVEGSDDAIISTSLTDIVTSWNHGAESLFGYVEEEMVGQPLSVLLPPDRADEDVELVAELRRDVRIRHRDSLRRTKDGRNIVVSMTISPIRDQAGTLIGGSTVARDITERTNAERALAAAKERAEITSREFEAFSYSVAHDLRAPLRAMDSFSQRLVERHSDALDAPGQDCLRRISEAAQYMAELIDSLLRLARLSNVKLVRQAVDLSALAAETMARLRALSPERDAELVIEPGLIGWGDRGLLTIVFENLLGNAWKFSRDQALTQIEFGHTQVGNETVYILRDNGAGFDMAYSAKLFEVFQRLHTNREFEGIGIGLVSVQRIIGRHGGRIWGESAPGRGATFSFTLDPEEQ
jgi:PAS domain S-box-containing protein